MCLIKKTHNICDANVQKVTTQLCTVFKITSHQFLCSRSFVGKHSQISVQNSPHTSVRQPYCSRVFPRRTPWGFLNRSPDNCHIFRPCCGPRSARRCLFQCRTCLSKVWYPTVNRFLIRNSLPSTKRKADAKCTLCCYRRRAISYKLLNNKGSLFSRLRHGVHWKRNAHRCSTTRSPPEAKPLPNRGVLSAASCTTEKLFSMVNYWGYGGGRFLGLCGQRRPQKSCTFPVKEQPMCRLQFKVEAAYYNTQTVEGIVRMLDTLAVIVSPTKHVPPKRSHRRQYMPTYIP